METEEDTSPKFGCRCNRNDLNLCWVNESGADT